MSQEWLDFYEYENSGTGDAWIERMMLEVAGSGLYAFCIVRPPDDENDVAYTEWDSDEPVAPQQVFGLIADAIRSRGLGAECAIEAAIKLVDHLPTNDADVVCRSVATALDSDQQFRMVTKKLPTGTRSQIQQIMESR